MTYNALKSGPKVKTPRPHRNLRKRESRGMLVAFTAPAIVWYTSFTIGPLVAMFVIATLEWRSIIARPTFLGLDNFVRVFNDPVFWQAVQNTSLFMVFSLPVMVPIAFMIGYYVSLGPPLQTFIKTALFTPALISLAAKSMIFLAIFAPTGALNATLRNIGLDQLATAWLANPGTALGAVIVVELWGGIGFMAVLFASRLGGVAPEVLEAATIDGAGHWRRMWAISYPIIRDYFGVVLMLQFTWMLFGSAGTILLLTNGGPGYESTTLAFLIYDKAFLQSQIGYSQAVGVVIFVIGLFGVLGIRRSFRTAV